MQRRQELAIVTALSLKEFDLEEFKQKFRKIEQQADGDQSFPLGTVRGDLEALIKALLFNKAIEVLPNGRYKCLIES